MTALKKNIIFLKRKNLTGFCNPLGLSFLICSKKIGILPQLHQFNLYKLFNNREEALISKEF